MRTSGHPRVRGLRIVPPTHETPYLRILLVARHPRTSQYGNPFENYTVLLRTRDYFWLASEYGIQPAVMYACTVDNYLPSYWQWGAASLEALNVILTQESEDGAW